MLSIFSGVLQLPETNVCYPVVLRVLCDIGAKMTNEDAFVACGLFGDYGLPKIVPLLKVRACVHACVCVSLSPSLCVCVCVN
jgi:hypothetical protein